MATYKIGDKVLVRGDLSKEHGASEQMVKNWAGKVVTISEVEPKTLFGQFDNTYYIAEDNNPTGFHYIWWDTMIENIVSEETEKKVAPMPKLETGMFGMEHDGELFVVVNDKAVYQMGLCEDVEFLMHSDKVKALYEAICFKQIDDGRAKMIWSADGEIIEPKKEEGKGIMALLDMLEKALERCEDDGK